MNLSLLFQHMLRMNLMDFAIAVHILHNVGEVLNLNAVLQSINGKQGMYLIEYFTVGSTALCLRC